MIAITPPGSKNEFLLSQYLALYHSDRPFFLLHDANGSIASIIESIILCSTSRPYNWRLIRRALYSQLIITLLNFYPNTLRPEKELLSEKNIAIAVTQYLHANYQNSQLDLASLSKEFNFSTKHLVRMFENYFSKTPSKTLTFYRINYAKNYLLNTDWSIDEIADAVGFSSAASLSRCFKEIENITIKEFKDLNKK